MTIFAQCVVVFVFSCDSSIDQKGFAVEHPLFLRVIALRVAVKDGIAFVDLTIGDGRGGCFCSLLRSVGLPALKFARVTLWRFALCIETFLVIRAILALMFEVTTMMASFKRCRRGCCSG